MSLAITMEYLEVGAETSNLVSVPPDRFFDSDGAPNFNHAHEYLDIAPARLCWTLLEVTGNDVPYRIRTQYFPHGAGWMTHRTDADGSEEIIHVVRVPEGTESGGTQLVLKTTKPMSGEWMVVGATRVRDDEHSDLLQLRDHYSADTLLPASVPGSFATVTHPKHSRRGPWPNNG